MEDNIYDTVMTKLMARVEAATDKVAKNFKNVKPFDKEPMPKKELYQSYAMLTPEDMDYLITMHGEAKVNDFIRDMEQERMKEVNNAGWEEATTTDTSLVG